MMTPISNKSSSQYYNYMKKCVICLLFNVRMASPEVVGVALTKVGFLVVCLPSNHPCTGGGHKKAHIILRNFALRNGEPIKIAIFRGNLC